MTNKDEIEFIEVKMPLYDKSKEELFYYPFPMMCFYCTGDKAHSLDFSCDGKPLKSRDWCEKHNCKTYPPVIGVPVTCQDVHEPQFWSCGCEERELSLMVYK
jgi:hypothetical protein